MSPGKILQCLPLPPAVANDEFENANLWKNCENVNSVFPNTL